MGRQRVPKGKIILVIPIGAPASGKSTYGKLLFHYLTQNSEETVPENISILQQLVGIKIDKIILNSRDDLYQEITVAKKKISKKALQNIQYQ